MRHILPYSSMLGINVLYLNHTDLATPNDEANDLVYWARLFQATTWEELKDLSTHDPAFEEVATVMYNSNIQSEEKTIMEAHQRYLGMKNSLIHSLSKAEKKIETLTSENERLKARLTQSGISIDK